MVVAGIIKRQAMHVREQGIYRNSLVPAQFCSEPTYSALKNRDLLKKENKKNKKRKKRFQSILKSYLLSPFEQNTLQSGRH